MKFAYAVIDNGNILRVCTNKERAEEMADAVKGYVVELHIVYDAT